MKIFTATALACLLAASTSTFAADPAVQRVAQSCAAAPHAMGCTSNNSGSLQGRSSHARVANPEAPEVKSVKSHARAHSSVDARVGNDGSRFQYDSCGCSGT